ncbi:hypothetical protein [Gryllotalpicola protaetiae]|uniref:Uncharacterized protein n=1 Tax=Gryllotalpicola protaetiae TaxID=2419771 RepID=A0A387BMW8_9MICO|nr:hypothetical protein [Gryllotalpicola protaetiae]AYG05555.1 hypothetical protein D7I44_17920 [Gryllotalpicola protaetiae]
MRKLAAQNRADYREHDPVRSAAHERALDTIRDGTAQRAIRAGNIPAYLTSVPIAGRPDDIIVWELIHEPEGDRAIILWLGPLDPL